MKVLVQKDDDSYVWQDISATNTFAASVTTSTPNVYTVNGNIIGGTASFTYLWQIKSDTPALAGTSLINIASDGTTHTVTLTAATSTSRTGLLSCKITDANGLVTYAYWYVWQSEPS